MPSTPWQSALFCYSGGRFCHKLDNVFVLPSVAWIHIHGTAAVVVGVVATSPLIAVAGLEETVVCIFEWLTPILGTFLY